MKKYRSLPPEMPKSEPPKQSVMESLRNLRAAIGDVANDALQKGNEYLDQSEAGRKVKEVGEKVVVVTSICARNRCGKGHRASRCEI